MDKLEMLQSLTDWRGRRYRRFELEFPVRLKFQVGSTSAEIETISKNVSIGGLLVRSTLSVPEHTPITFDLNVHGRETFRPVHLVGEGRIVRVETGEAEGTFVIAVKCSAPVTQLEEYLPTQ
jgi:hypothetical protein